jgi:glycosyltransferase involved in cell wall biosynthesis
MISVLIPTLGRASLEEVIQSINDQQVENLTIILVDDSKNGLGEGRINAIKKLVNLQLIYLRTLGMIGPAKARNLGLEKVATKWVAFADDDDPWEKQRLKKQFLMMDQLKLEASVLLDSKNYTKKILWQGLNSPLHFLYEKSGFRRNNRYIPFGTLVYNFDLYKNVRFNTELKEREDLYFLYEIYNTNKKIKQLPIVGCHVTRNRVRSIRRPNYADDLGWYNYLSSIERKLANNFLIFVSIRNSLFLFDAVKLYKTLKHRAKMNKTT